MEFLLGYADFLLRTLTVLVAIIVVLYATGVFWGLICNGLGVVF